MMTLPRIRQFVFICKTIAAADELKMLFNLGEPYFDPEVSFFGLENAVFAIGDQFLEIVTPLPKLDPNKVAGGRFLSRSGPGGYMMIFQVADIAVARTRVDAMGIRRVFNHDSESISASHLHPSDAGAVILSIDEPRPPESWEWGGPDWLRRSTSGQLKGAVLGSPEPKKLASKWSNVLGVSQKDNIIDLEDGQLIFKSHEKEKVLAYIIGQKNVEEVIQRAQSLHLTTDNNTIDFHGVDLILKPS